MNPKFKSELSVGLYAQPTKTLKRRMGSLDKKNRDCCVLMDVHFSNQSIPPLCLGGPCVPSRQTLSPFKDSIIHSVLPPPPANTSIGHATPRGISKRRPSLKSHLSSSLIEPEPRNFVRAMY